MAARWTPTFREVGSSAEIGPGSACPESIDVRDPSIEVPDRNGGDYERGLRYMAVAIA